VKYQQPLVILDSKMTRNAYNNLTHTEQMLIDYAVRRLEKYLRGRGIKSVGEGTLRELLACMGCLLECPEWPEILP
jgi:hypothetical protein